MKKLLFIVIALFLLVAILLIALTYEPGQAHCEGTDCWPTWTPKPSKTPEPTVTPCELYFPIIYNDPLGPPCSICHGHPTTLSGVCTR